MSFNDDHSRTCGGLSLLLVAAASLLAVTIWYALTDVGGGKQTG
jgi:hypothetical protein